MATSAVGCRKRSLTLEPGLESLQSKKVHYWYRLASESSSVSTDDTESVYSVQEKETDVVRDTSDTKSDTSEYDIDIEYEIGSISDDDRDMIFFDSSDESEDMIYAAAVVGDSSLETFVTDAEDSDNSRQDESSTGLTDFWICIQCKSQNDNPQYRFCDKCFQDRKAIFPPRPQRRKKADRSREKPVHTKVEIDVFKSCLKNISKLSEASPQDSPVSVPDSGTSSQDSGIGSSQEFVSLCFDQIKIPAESAPSSSLKEEVKNRKRQHSESSLSEYEVKRPKKQAKICSETKEKKKEKCEQVDTKIEEEKKSDNVNGVCREQADATRTKADDVKGALPELSEDCIMCNAKPKNSVFLHGRIAHMCCCYGCAMRTWKSLKRCPICKRKVSNVVRVFTI